MLRAFVAASMVSRTTHMNDPVQLRTERLVLRQWRPEDREPFARMCADARVMEYFPSTLTREQSDGVVDRIQAGIEQRGFGFWALEIHGVAPFAGFVGLSEPGFQTHFTPCVEIGWRVARQYWNRGYATEAARAALRYGFEVLKLREIVAFAVWNNRASRRVMEKLGMTYDAADDFNHPNIPEGHPHRPHVLYRIRAGADQR